MTNSPSFPIPLWHIPPVFAKMFASCKSSPHDEAEAVMPRRLLTSLWLCLVLVAMTSLSSFDGVAFAQAPAAPSGVVKTQSTSNYYVDGAIVVVLFGGALFAVCRSSRRN